ncbi:UNVERIFIED_CONTAM: hypothetical protein GTU68_009565 [Idotea baltica]|nr:hypothetical protein [Idotea baltica]
MHGSDRISIGDLATRTGLSVSAIRFYETKGLVAPIRNNGGQRRFYRSDIRRLSFVMVAQKLGFSIQDIRDQLATLPSERTPTKADWTRISRAFGAVLDERIETLTRLRTYLDGCIGCGCLSLKRCTLLNPDDAIGEKGSGPRYILGDRPNTSE